MQGADDDDEQKCTLVLSATARQLLFNWSCLELGGRWGASRAEDDSDKVMRKIMFELDNTTMGYKSYQLCGLRYQ